MSAASDDDNGHDDSLPIAGPSRQRAGAIPGRARPLQQRASTATSKARQKEKPRPSLADRNGHAQTDLDMDMDVYIDDDGSGDRKGSGAKSRMEDPETDIQRLMRHWMDERAAPELLYLQEDLLSAIMERSEAQVRSILHPSLQY